MLTAEHFFDLSEFTFADLFTQDDYVWTALSNLKSYMDNYSYPALDRALLPDGKPLVETIVLHQGQLLSSVNLEIEFGDAGYRIADHAKQLNADLIVMPSHGRSGITRLLIGSVAERVVRLAHCPVLVLRG